MTDIILEAEIATLRSEVNSLEAENTRLRAELATEKLVVESEIHLRREAQDTVVRLRADLQTTMTAERELRTELAGARKDTANAVWLGFSDEDVAELFHDHYEELAPTYSHETQPHSRVEWKLVPENVRCLAVDTVSAVRLAMVAAIRSRRDDEGREGVELPWTCPEHPGAQVRHSWDQTHFVVNGTPVGTGTRGNHRYECSGCGRELAATQTHTPAADAGREGGDG